MRFVTGSSNASRKVPTVEVSQTIAVVSQNVATIFAASQKVAKVAIAPQTAATDWLALIRFAARQTEMMELVDVR